MNEDYLWDKSGDDPEIENLEKMLAVFRYRETEAPAMQAAQPVAIVVPSPRWKFSFAYAFAAVLVVVIVAGVWIRTSSGTGGFEKDMVSVTPSQPSSEPPDRPNAITDAVVLNDKVHTLDRRSRPLRITAKRTASLGDRQAKPASVRSAQHGTAALTKEEKYAYGQLMLALSITSSKLKIVKDTMNGVEERESPVNENKR